MELFSLKKRKTYPVLKREIEINQVRGTRFSLTANQWGEQSLERGNAFPFLGSNSRRH